MTYSSRKDFDLGGFRKRRARGDGFGLLVVCDDLVADVNAFVADVDGGAGDELLDFVLRFAAERAAQRVISSAYHKDFEGDCLRPLLTNEN